MAEISHGRMSSLDDAVCPNDAFINFAAELLTTVFQHDEGGSKRNPGFETRITDILLQNAKKCRPMDFIESGHYLTGN